MVERTTGPVRLPATIVETQPFNVLKAAGRFAGSPEPTSYTALTFSAPAYLTRYDGPTFEAAQVHAQLVHNGRPNATLDPDIEALMAKIKDSGNGRRYNVEFFTLKVMAGTGTVTAPVVVGGQSYDRAVENAYAAIPPALTFGFHVPVKSGGLGLFCRPADEELFIDGANVDAVRVISPSDG